MIVVGMVLIVMALVSLSCLLVTTICSALMFSYMSRLIRVAYGSAVEDLVTSRLTHLAGGHLSFVLGGGRPHQRSHS